MSEQRDHLDYSGVGGDSGEDNVDSIQPVEDGEGASQSVLRRPSENLRGRTETVRTSLRDLFYYRDFNHIALHSTGTVEWGGTVALAGDGKVTNTADLYLRPFLTPDASKKGVLTIGAIGTDEVTYTVQNTAYATDGMNAVLVEHSNTGAATLTATISDGPVKHILVTFDSTNSAHDAPTAVSAVNAAITADTDLSGKLLASTTAAAGDAIVAASKTRIEGTADQEAHRIPATALSTFTTTNPLAEGDCLAVWYRYVVEPSAGFGSDPKGAAAGGRWESNPERANDDVTNNLFITSDDPNKIPGAIPLCKVLDNQLIWIDGTRLSAGGPAPLGTSLTSFVDDSLFQGLPTLVVNGGLPNPLSPSTAQEAFNQIDDRLGHLRFATYVCTDGAASTGGNFNGANALQNAVDAAAGPALIFLRRGIYTVNDTFATGTDKWILGEDRDSVIITQTASASFALSSNVRLENVTLTVGPVGGVETPTTAAFVYLKNVKMTKNYLNMKGKNCLYEDIEFTDTGTAANQLSVDSGAIGNTVRNVLLTSTCLLQGSNNTFENIRVVTVIGTGASIAIEGGNQNTLRNAYLGPRTTDLASVNAGVLKVTGDSNRIENVTINQVGSALTAQRAGLAIEGTDNCVFSNVTVQMGTGYALATKLNGSTPNQNTLFEGCRFLNLSTDSSDHTVQIPTSHEGSHKLNFTGCYFSQQEQEEHQLFLMRTASGARQRFNFSNCQFVGATFNGNPCTTFLDSSFEECLFTFDPGTNSGGEYIPGDDQGVTTLWDFTVGVQLGMGCDLRQCVFDLRDLEVLNAVGSGDADFSGSIVRLVGARANSIHLINVNQHMLTNGGGLIEMSTGSELSDLEVNITSTAAVQGGAADIDPVVNVTGSNIYLHDTSLKGGSTTGTPLALSNPASQNVHLKKISIEQGVGGTLQGGISWATTTATTDFQKIIIEDCTFGSAATPCTAVVSFPLGDYSAVRNCNIYSNLTSLPPISLGRSQAAISVAFEGNNFSLETVAVQDGVIGTLGVDITRLRFNNNTIKFNFVGAAKLFDGAPTGVTGVAAGNIVVNTGGTIGTGDVTLSAPNLGI